MGKRYINNITGLLSFFLMLNTFSAYCQLPVEEYNGPLSSWANLKSISKAKGDGISDDTEFLQGAIDKLGVTQMGGGSYAVLYIPAGVYCISSTLNLKGKIGVDIIGEDPNNTIIKWIGSKEDTMLLANGSAYYKISRLTWNAGDNGVKEGIGIHWLYRWRDANSESYASLNIEISDNYFTGNFEVGIGGGTSPQTGTNHNDSEICIKRCVFSSCSYAGINISGYNALDYWIWDSKFLSCRIGIYSAFGNFHAYRCYFESSKIVDVFHENGYYTSLRGCFSKNSSAFSQDKGASTNPFKRIFQKNIIVNPTKIPIEFYHTGKITAIQNYFGRSLDTSVKTSIRTGSWAAANYKALSIGNKFVSKGLVEFTNSPNKLYNINTNTVSDADIISSETFIETMDKLPAFVKRNILEVPLAANTKKIQSVLDEAAKKKELTIVHFPIGNYYVDEQLSISVGANIKIIGDGFLRSTNILPSDKFPKGKSIIKVNCPGKIYIENIQIGHFKNKSSGINGIEFRNADDKESKVYIDQIYSNSKSTLTAENMDYIYIQKDNSFFADGNRFTGGKLSKKGKGKSRLYCFGGQYAGISVDNGASIVAKDCWWEGARGAVLNLSGKGNITLEGFQMAPKGLDTSTSIIINKFSGRISILSAYMYGGVSISNVNPDLNLLFWNTHFLSITNPLKFFHSNATYKGAFIGLSSQCSISGDKSCGTINTVNDLTIGVSDTLKFMNNMLQDDINAFPRKYMNSKPGSTTIYFHRVSLGDFEKALCFYND